MNVQAIISYDFDLDGDQDIIGNSSTDGRILALLNNDNGYLWEEYEITSNNPGVSTMQKGDLDNNGTIDIVTFSTSEDRIKLYKKANQNSDFSEIVLLENIETNTNLNLKDFNNDGHIDVLFDHSISQSGWLKNAIETFSMNPYIFSNYAYNKTLTVADIDGDNDNDIVSVGNNQEDIRVLQNTSNGNFNETFLVPNSYGNPSDVKLGDLDGDDDLDIVVSFKNSDNISWYENMPVKPRVKFFVEENCWSYKSIQNSSFAFYPDSEILWDFGDGSVSDEINPIYNYSNYGTYILSCRICNSIGCDSMQLEVEVSNLANFEIPGIWFSRPTIVI